MTPQSESRPQRLQELYVGDLLFGLTPEEQLEFESLKPITASDQLPSLSEILALLDLARATEEQSQLPPELKAKIQLAAQRDYLNLANPARPTQSRRGYSRATWLTGSIFILLFSSLLFYFFQFRN